MPGTLEMSETLEMAGLRDALHNEPEPQKDLFDRIMTCQQGHEVNPDEDEEMEEECEEISEEELLALLEAEQDSLVTCQGLFRNDSIKLLSISPAQMHQFQTTGMVVVDDFVDMNSVKCMHKNALQYLLDQKLTPASMVRLEDDPFRARNVRSDSICWLSNEVEFSPLLTKLETLYQDLSQMMGLIGEKEFQLAHYAANGIGYDTHRDAFPTNDPTDNQQRKVTAICYLNPNWIPSDQGCLRIHRPGLEQDIQPLPGRLVLFLSGVIDHQVLPSTADRLAITCWIK